MDATVTYSENYMGQKCISTQYIANTELHNILLSASLKSLHHTVLFGVLKLTGYFYSTFDFSVHDPFKIIELLKCASGFMPTNPYMTTRSFYNNKHN